MFELLLVGGGEPTPKVDTVTFVQEYLYVDKGYTETVTFVQEYLYKETSA